MAYSDGMLKAMKKEDIILLECIRDVMQDKRADSILHKAEFTNTNYNWQNLFKKANAHNVMGYVLKNIKSLEELSIPTDFFQKIKKSHLERIALSIALTNSLKDILIKFENDGIRSILLKGALLNSLIYDNISLRTFTDIDLLIKPEDLQRAVGIIESLGYTKASTNESLAKKEGRTQIHYIKDGLVVDLHVAAINSSQYSAISKFYDDNLWQNAVQFKFHDTHTWRPQDEDLLIYSCIHLSVHHNYDKMIWLKDIERILTKLDIDWLRFEEKVIKNNLRTYCYFPLLFAERIFNVEIPHNVLDRLKPQYLSALLFDSLIVKANLIDLYANKRRFTEQLWMLLRDTQHERIMAMRCRFLPSIEWFMHYYPFLPKNLKPLYYVIYPSLLVLRLFKKPYDQLKAFNA